MSEKKYDYIDKISHNNNINYDKYDIESEEDIEDIEDTMEYENEDTKHKNDKKAKIFKKTNLLFLNNGWNENNEKIIISIGENAASYKWMHERNASLDKRGHDFISISLILLSTLLSADTILSYSQGETNETITIIIKVFIYIINILSVLQQFLKLQDSSNLHMEYANSFIRLYHDIQQQMSTYRSHRLNASKYVSECIKKFDSLVIKGPSINFFIIKHFKRKFNKSNISLPDIVDNIQKIEIISEPIEIKEKSIGVKSINLDNFVESKKTDSKHNNCNLKTMNNIFKIEGDISDTDIKDLDPLELKSLKKKFLKAKSEYEYKRYLQHSLDID